MSFSLMFANTGLGLSDSDVGTYWWAGHSYNPTSDTSDGYQSWDIWEDSSVSGDFSVAGQTVNFDLSGYQYGLEVVIAAIQFYVFDDPDNGMVYLKFYDPDSNQVLSRSWAWSCQPSYFRYYWIGMGLGANGQEVWKNGTYTFYYKVTYNGGADYVEDTVEFTVSNYPTVNVPGASYRGAIWVEGDYLHFISYDIGAEIVVPHDGSSSYKGTDYAGAIWLEDNGRITYIDASGYKRRTKLGDRYGYGGWSSEIPDAPGEAYKGAIWVSSDYNDTYIMIVSPNGVKYRIGAGAVSGDYQ